jgi:hypothetical protein
MRMSKLHSGTTYISRDGKHTRIGDNPGWRGHSSNEMTKRRAHNKVAKQARKVNRVR